MLLVSFIFPIMFLFLQDSGEDVVKALNFSSYMKKQLLNRKKSLAKFYKFSSLQGWQYGA